MELFKELILHITFIIFPVFLYQAIWLNKPAKMLPRQNNLLIYFFSAASALLCMTYPIAIFNSVSFDLQSVPVITSILYGGPVTGAFVVLTVIGYRLYLGGDSMIIMLSTMPLHLILPFYLYKHWYSMKYSSKMLWALLLAVLKIVIVYTALYTASSFGLIQYQLTEQRISTLFYSGLFLLVVFLLTIHAIEYILENALLRVQLLKSEKFSIVSELAASVAHEVRNPLTVVRGFIQLIGSENRDPKEKEYVKLVLSELDRAQEIITDYLNLAKHQHFDKTQINLSTLLTEIENIMISYANYKNVQICSEIAPSLTIYGDQSRLKQVFINLIKNAIEAVPESGGNVMIKAYSSHDVVRIKIQDNGNGMSEEQLERLGEPFFTLKERGTGLGLTVTFSIVENHLGSIRFQSALKKGTTATVTLPSYIEKIEKEEAIR
ncbi:sporulation kinase [Bacillus lacus]|uniref:histidine kinase n=1 Tax=Metabacillus lacus TaxID=1983721 RepID=A0A7X2J2X2_9BACI|nr:sensor histidine kinase [Metabacillus lacus]MRX73588.1 sporulation kinase [Metabacillus lacus]